MAKFLMNLTCHLKISNDPCIESDIWPDLKFKIHALLNTPKGHIQSQ
jgi:hypothetical protein